MRDLDLLLQKAAIRTHNEHALRASLHGLKIPLKEASISNRLPVLEPEEELVVKRAKEQAFAAKRKRIIANG
jgi:hypothetical protein